ncbi:MAG TPA: 4-alpha-glucanotransferase [Thermoanaerobaculia bacterium]|nr:4-alpha-glucanotransferase [Thermoanaerobaculia bacterium]
MTARSPEARAAGILLHVSSLPSAFGVGDLGPAAVRFLDWAAAAGQSLWQVLPLGPTGAGDSPYGGASAFAGNPLFISPEGLVEEGWLDSLSPAEGFSAAGKLKEALLRRAFERANALPQSRGDFERFRSAPEQAPWLADWSLYEVLHRRAGGAGWIAWDAPLAQRDPSALNEARRSLTEEIEFAEWTQFVFFRQWERLRTEASRRGIRIVGDLPIYVAHDSADVWAHRELFALDERGFPERVAGVPPDYFSATGQLWGYPVYRWEAHASSGFAWWTERLRTNLRLADAVRIDHFRGFASFWEVPAAERTALNGRWSPGPGRALFDAAAKALGGGPLPVIAEDLGFITPDVTELLDELGFPRMKVLQFAFSQDDSPHLPHRHIENAVVYTGTHDNDTSAGWARELSDEERERFLLYAGVDPGAGALLRLAYESVARWAIAPMQDVLELPGSARMNTPGVAEGNWAWRARASDFGAETAARLRRLAAVTGRSRKIPLT